MLLVSTCFVSGCTANKLQDPTILILSVMYILIATLVLGASCLQSGSLKINLYTLSGVILASAQVSILALKYFVFFF